MYTEIVLCVLRRYEKKQGLSSKSDDLMSIYRDDLVHLERVALHSLRKGELYFEEPNLEVPLLLYPSLDFFHSRLVAVRGKLLYVMHFSTKASKSSLLDFILLAKFLTEVLTVSQ